VEMLGRHGAYWKKLESKARRDQEKEEKKQ
jgi:hypothetical protein